MVFELAVRFIELLQLVSTSNFSVNIVCALCNSRQRVLSRLSLLCLHHSSGNGFRRQTFPFLWVPKLSPRLSHSYSRLSSIQLLLSQEDSLWTGSCYATLEDCLFIT
jgi:hypothetical protein